MFKTTTTIWSSSLCSCMLFIITIIRSNKNNNNNLITTTTTLEVMFLKFDILIDYNKCYYHKASKSTTSTTRNDSVKLNKYLLSRNQTGSILKRHFRKSLRQIRKGTESRTFLFENSLYMRERTSIWDCDNQVHKTHKDNLYPGELLPENSLTSDNISDAKLF